MSDPAYDTPRCETCRNWRPEPIEHPDFGECRQGPPALGHPPTIGGARRRGTWYSTHKDEDCGMYCPRPSASPAAIPASTPGSPPDRLRPDDTEEAQADSPDRSDSPAGLSPSTATTPPDRLHCDAPEEAQAGEPTPPAKPATDKKGNRK